MLLNHFSNLYVPLLFPFSLALTILKRTHSECLWFSHDLIKSMLVKANNFRSTLIPPYFMNLSYHFFPLWFTPLWFQETNLTQPWVCSENKWVTFFRLPGDRKEDGRKLLEKCNHYCNRPAVLWISHNYLTIWVNAGMLSLVVSTCACTYQEDPQSGCNTDHLKLALCLHVDHSFTHISLALSHPDLQGLSSCCFYLYAWMPECSCAMLEIKPRTLCTLGKHSLYH